MKFIKALITALIFCLIFFGMPIYHGETWLYFVSWLPGAVVGNLLSECID